MPGRESVAVTPESVTLPVFRIDTVQVMVSPATPVAPPGSVPDLTTWSRGSPAAVGVVTVPDAALTGVPFGDSPLPVATLTIEPASTSACVIVWLARATTCAPGASTPASPGQVYVKGVSPAIGSLTTTLRSVTLPVLVTRTV